MPILLGGVASFFFGLTLFGTSVFLILLVLVQRGRGGGLTGALGGAGGQSAFGAKAGDVFTRVTGICALVWFLLCVGAIAALQRDNIVLPGADVENRSDGKMTGDDGDKIDQSSIDELLKDAATKAADATDSTDEGGDTTATATDDGTKEADDAASNDDSATKPAEDNSTDDKSADDKPAEDKPAEDKPAEDKPAEDKPAEDKPAEDKPAEDKPAEDKPAEDKPAEEAPKDE